MSLAVVVLGVAIVADLWFILGVAITSWREDRKVRS